MMWLKSCLAVTVLILTACTGSQKADSLPAGDTLTQEARLLNLVECDGFTVAEVTNPWDTTKMLGRYALVPRDADIPAEVTDGGFTVIRVPVESSLVYSSVHAGAIGELGAIRAVTGVADAGYFKLPDIKRRLQDGSVVDVGSSMNPSAEKIVQLDPEIILVSPFNNAGHGVLETMGVPIVEVADYMEQTPLGRAEWIKLLGHLYGRPAEADSIYNSVADAYKALVAKTAGVEVRPSVISETATDGVWYLPGGHSYMARLFADAGASYPWADDASTGSLQLDVAQVLDRASDADVWLLRTYGYDMTLDALRRDNPLNSRFKAFSSGGVYACNTADAMLFEEFPFHPEKILHEYLCIFHPELMADGDTLKYYRKVK